MPAEEDWSEADFSDDSATFGDRVTAAREAMGVSVAQLARQAGVKAETVLNWEADRSEPRPNKLQMLAGVLNVPLLWLMAGQGPGPDLRPRSGAAVAPAVMAELREIRAEQLRLAERLSRLARSLTGAP